MKTFRILALDGGGIRGAFQAAFLAELEKQLPHPIGRYFDLVVGTSTGGIIATALALDMPASQILDFYETHGSAIFGKRQVPRRRGLWRRLVGWGIDRWLRTPNKTILKES